MLSDLKFAVRGLLRSPGFAAIAVLILGLGIGTNTAIFSAFNTVLLRSLPVADPHNLRAVAWWTDDPAAAEIKMWVTARRDDVSGTTYDAFSYPTYEAFRDSAVGFDSIFAFGSIAGATVKAPGSVPTAEDGLFVSGSFFDGYGGQALKGRLLSAQDDRPDAVPVAVITHRFWAERFALDPQVVGKTIVVNDIGLEIVGVLPRTYRGPLPGDPTRFYVPLALNRVLPRSSWMAIPSLTEPNFWSLQVMARRNTEVDERRAQASLDLLFKQSLQTLGTTPKPGKAWRIVLMDGAHGPMSAARVQKAVAKPMYVLAAAAAALLLLTCANLAGLMLVRALARQRDWAVRAAVGAGRWRLIRQPLSEALVLAAAGCVLGVGLAVVFTEVIAAIVPRLLSLPMPAGAKFTIDLDATVLAFAIGVSSVSVLLCGLFPGLQASRMDLFAGLKTSSASASRQRVGKTLICVQVALSVLLLVGSGLLARTSFNLIQIDPGFEPENVLLFDLAPGESVYGEHTTRVRFFDDVRRSISALSGVQDASLSAWPMLAGFQMESAVTVRDHASGPATFGSSIMLIGDAFLSTMRLPLLLGREFTSMDTATSERAAIVNEEFARRFLKSSNALGMQIDMDGRTYRIVGVAGDSLFVGVKDGKRPLVYLSLRQNPAPPRVTFAIRSTLPMGTLVPAIKRTVAGVDAEVPVLNVRTQSEQTGKLTATERLLAVFSGCTAGVAAVLASFGLFSLLAYSVTRRRSEIGVRGALGAQRADVVKLIVGQAVRLVTVGAVIGCVVALWATQLLSSFLFGVNPIDPITMGAAVVAFAIVAGVASYLPARMAAKIDPLTALRTE